MAPPRPAGSSQVRISAPFLFRAQASVTMQEPCAVAVVEIEIDLWALVEEMLPGLLEIERIESLAAKNPNQSVDDTTTIDADMD